jgi:hypothetical protein
MKHTPQKNSFFNEIETVLRIPINQHDDIRVRVVEMSTGGLVKRKIDIRVFKPGRDGWAGHTPKGIILDFDALPLLRRALADLDEWRR